MKNGTAPLFKVPSLTLHTSFHCQDVAIRSPSCRRGWEMSFYSGKPFAELQNQESVTEREGENQREESTVPATFALAAGYRGCAGHRCPQGTRGVNLTTPWDMDAQRSMTGGRVMAPYRTLPLTFLSPSKGWSFLPAAWRLMAV